MAEAAKGQSQAKDLLNALSVGASPDALTRWLKQVYGGEVPPGQVELFTLWTQNYWETLGFVPKARFEELERHYLELKKQLEAAEREAAVARTLLSLQGQEEKAKEAVDAWSEAVQTTLSAQTKWWSSWLGSVPGQDDGQE